MIGCFAVCGKACIFSPREHERLHQAIPSAVDRARQVVGVVGVPHGTVELVRDFAVTNDTARRGAVTFFAAAFTLDGQGVSRGAILHNVWPEEDAVGPGAAAVGSTLVDICLRRDEASGASCGSADAALLQQSPLVPSEAGIVHKHAPGGVRARPSGHPGLQREGEECQWAGWAGWREQRNVFAIVIVLALASPTREHYLPCRGSTGTWMRWVCGPLVPCEGERVRRGRRPERTPSNILTVLGEIGTSAPALHAQMRTPCHTSKSPLPSYGTAPSCG